MTIYSRLCFIFFTVSLLSWITSCRPNADNEEKARQCKTFVDTAYANYYAAKDLSLMRRIDSFYAHNDLPPFCDYIRYKYLRGLYYNRGRYDSALIYTDSSIAILEDNELEKKYTPDYAGSLNMKGQILYLLGNYSEAYNYYFMAGQYAGKLKDTCALSPYNYHLGMLAYKQRNYAAAANYFKLTVKYYMRCRERSIYTVPEYLSNIALSYEKRQMPDSALFYYDSALSYLNNNSRGGNEEIFRDKALGAIYGDKGGVLLSVGATDSAIGLLRRGYLINIQRSYDNQDALLTHLKLANAYLQKGDLERMEESLLALRTELDTIQHEPAAEAAWQELMYFYNERIGNLAGSLAHYKRNTAIRDSISAIERDQMQVDVIRAMDKKELDYRMSQLQRKNHNKGLYLSVTVTILAMALLIVVLIYLNYRKGRKNIQALTALKTELEKADKDKDKIMDIVVHDLRGPVSGIYTVADMMLAEDRPEADEEWINMIKGASESALSLINQLMGYKNDGREVLVKSPYDIVKIADDTVKLLQLRANDKGILLRKHLPPASVTVRLDKEKINRVLTNLIANAIKFSRYGTAIDVSVEDKNTSVLLTVKDAGIGIPQMLQNEVFGMFNTAKRLGTAGEKSFGLGLSITKQIIDLHGGKIWLESEEGKGTTFFVELLK